MGDSLTKPPFKVTNRREQVVIICPKRKSPRFDVSTFHGSHPCLLGIVRGHPLYIHPQSPVKGIAVFLFPRILHHFLKNTFHKEIVTVVSKKNRVTKNLTLKMEDEIAFRDGFPGRCYVAFRECTSLRRI